MSRQFHDLEIALFTEDYFLQSFFRFYFLIVPVGTISFSYYARLYVSYTIRRKM